MILVHLDVNGRVHSMECRNKEEAKQQVKIWLAEAKKSFPHPQAPFVPVYYEARRVMLD